jgi:hypothetical protein
MWTPRAGHHVADPTPGVGSHAGWDISGYRYTRRSSPGRVRCRAEWHTRRTNTARQTKTKQTSRLTASSDDCSKCLRSCKPRASTHSTLCEYQEYRCSRLVSDVSTHSTHAGAQQGPCGYSALCVGASKVPHAARVPVVLHECTRSTLSDRLQYPCEYSEYRLRVPAVSM